MKAFVGVHMLMSIVDMPNYKLYWSQDWIVNFPPIKNILPRRRYESLCKYLHCNDTSENPARGQVGHDRLIHVRPVLDEVLHRCITMYSLHRECTVDEAMVAFRGRLGFRQYMPAKPVKFGIKIWELADAQNGYVSNFQVYTGKVAGNVERGLTSRVVKDMTENIHGKNHMVVIDNYFSSVELLQDLLKKQVYCCATTRTNRKGWPGKLSKGCVKNPGESKIMQNGEIVALTWYDKKQVNFISSGCDPTSFTTVNRKQKDGTIRAVPCPSVVEIYGRFMNGVDRADQLRAMYPLGRRAVKWWKYLFWFLLDTCKCNAYICMVESKNHSIVTRNGQVRRRNMLEFHLALIKQLLGDFNATKRKRNQATRSPSSMSPNHWPIKRKKARCVQCSKQGVRSESTVGCVQCGKCLCISCFRQYHDE